MMIIANIAGIFAFLFFVWKRLREDYHYEKIFSLAFYVLLGFLISFVVSLQFFKDYWFWIQFAGVALGFIIGVWRQKIKIFESLEPLVVGFLAWLSLFFLSDSITSSSVYSFAAFWVSLSCVFIFFFFDSYYRRFSWYKSGKVGFSGLATLGIFFLVRSLVALLNLPVISLVGIFDAVVSGAISFLAFLTLFNLSRK